MDDQQLPGMPHPWPLRVTRTGDGRVVAVHAGSLLLSAFGAGDLEMRDLVICSLTEGSRFQGRTVAARSASSPPGVTDPLPLPRARRQGTGPPDGPPPDPQPRPAAAGPPVGRTGPHPREIGLRLGVSRSRISELIKQHGPLPAPGPLFGDTEAAGADPAARDGDDTASGQHAGGDGAGTAGQPAGGGTGTAPAKRR